MNKLLVTIAIIVAATYLPAQSPAAPEPPPVASEGPVKDIYPRWSVVGEWRVTHPVWTDVVLLRADGSLATSRLHTTGRWVLTAEAGTPMLVFRWDLFGTESVMMVGPDHFRGQTVNGTFIDMRRGEERADNSKGE